MSQYTNLTATAQVKTGTGRLFGIMVNSNTSGTFALNDGVGGTSAGVKATGVFTSSGALANGETLTIGTNTYTFVTALSGARNEVLLGANAAAALDNLKSAINATAGEGTTYGTGTVANPNVTATTNTDTEQTVEAYRVGTYANSIPTTETCANCAWGAATLASGANASVLMAATYTVGTGSSNITFPNPIDFATGLYLTVGGTLNATVIWE